MPQNHDGIDPPRRAFSPLDRAKVQFVQYALKKSCKGMKTYIIALNLDLTRCCTLYVKPQKR